MLHTNMIEGTCPYTIPPTGFLFDQSKPFECDEGVVVDNERLAEYRAKISAAPESLVVASPVGHGCVAFSFVANMGDGNVGESCDRHLCCRSLLLVQ